MMILPTFYCSTLQKQIAYGDNAYYYLDDDNNLTCVPYHVQDGILWDESVTYDPNVGASDDIATAECNAALSILSTY